MDHDDLFVDYYKILMVSPNCSARDMETAYHALAKKYHPDHAAVGDVAKLTEVINAYKILKSDKARADYDLLYTKVTGFVFSLGDDELVGEKSALSDAEAHAKILLFLYKKRRENAQGAGVGRYFVQTMLGCADDIFEFHLWYLKGKGLIATTEQGTLGITIEGIDHVISMSRSNLKETLLLSQKGEGQEQKNS